MKFDIRRILLLLKQHTLSIMAILAVAFIAVCSFYMLPSILAYNKALETGDKLGRDIGTVTGKAIGSKDGFLYGLNEGAQEGKSEGLSAKNTKAFISNSMKNAGNLEVLIASVKLKNLQEIGKKAENVTNSRLLNTIIEIGTSDDPYVALYIAKGKVIFSVDLKKVEIQVTDTSVTVLLPELTHEFYIDQDSVEKIAEYEGRADNLIFNGSAEEGYNAYLNTMAMTAEEIEKTVGNYDYLQEQAYSAAKEQVERLVESVVLGEKEIIIQIQEGENSDGE